MANFTSQVNTDLSVMANMILDALYPEVVVLKRVTIGVPTMGGLNYGDEIIISDITVSGAPATRSIGGAATASDLVALTKSMPKSHVYWGFKVDNIEEFFSSMPLRLKASSQLATGIGAQLDSNIIVNMQAQAVYEVGKADGSAVWNSTDLLLPLNQAYGQFKKNGVRPRNLHAAFGATESVNFRALPNLFKANEAGTSALLRQGLMGEIYGFEVLESDSIGSITVSANAATLTPGAVVGVNALGGATLSVNGIGTGTVEAGTTFTIAGDTNKLGYLNGYTVTADTAISGNAAVLPIFPKLRKVTAGSEAVVFAEHSAAGSANLAWDTESVLAYIAAPPAFTNIPSVTVTDEESGIGVRVSLKDNLLGTSGNAFNTEVVADVVFGTVVSRPEGVVRIGGAA